MAPRKKILILVLGFMTLLLGVVSVLVTLRIQQNLSPADGFADAGCSATCANGNQFNDACPYTFGSCQAWANEACATVGSTPTNVSGTIAPNCQDDDPGEDTCIVETPANVGRINFSAACAGTTFTIQRYTGDECVTTDNFLGQEPFTSAGNDSVTISAPIGMCAQIDAVGYGGSCICDDTPPEEEEEITPVVATQCPAGQTSPTGTITWGNLTGNTGGYYVDISTSATFQPFWSKEFNDISVLSTPVPAGFNGTPTLVLNSNTTYYVRVYFKGKQKYSKTVTFNAAACTTVNVPPPTGVSQCPTVGSTPTATINWTAAAQTSTYNVIFDNDNNNANGYWERYAIPYGTNSITYNSSEFTAVAPATGSAPTLLPNTTYFIAVSYNYLPEGSRYSAYASFTTANCSVTEPTCNQTCVVGGAACQNNLACIDTDTGSGTDYRCRLTANPTSDSCQPSVIVQPPTVISQCPVGQTTPTGTINWTAASQTSTYNVIFDTDNNPANGYWERYAIPYGTTSLTYNPSQFTAVAPATGSAPTLAASTTYYVKVSYNYLPSNNYSAYASFNTAACQTIIEACLDLTQNGTDPLKSGVGNTIQYTLRYRNAATTNPYPDITMRVGNGTDVEGRDANNTSNGRVSRIPGTQGYQRVTTNNDSIHVYKFRWEAANPAGVAVPNGTYNVRIALTSNTSVEITNPASCTDTLSVQSVAEQQPIFSVIKAGAPVCLVNGDAQINYTITVTNTGPVQGVIDFVEDNVDASLVALNILPTNINPSYGTYSGGKITWTGTQVERTYTAGQSKQFTYRITIPADRLLNFINNNGVYNQARVQWGTADNVDSFDLLTPLSCAVNILPETGIFDDARFLLMGLLLAIMGVLVYRLKLGNEVMEKVLNLFADRADGALSTLKPFEKNLEDKINKRRKEL